MNCTQAQQHINAAIDDQATDDALRAHLNQCTDCRRVEAEYQALARAFDELRQTTEAMRFPALQAEAPRTLRHARRINWLLPPALAAALLLALTAVYFNGAPRVPESVHHDPVAQVTSSPEAGVTLRDASREEYMIVALPQRHADVRIFRLFHSITQ